LLKIKKPSLWQRRGGFLLGLKLKFQQQGDHKGTPLRCSHIVYGRGSGLSPPLLILISLKTKKTSLWQRRRGFLLGIGWCVPLWTMTCYDLKIDFKLKVRQMKLEWDDAKRQKTVEMRGFGLC
jgi:hypothetical protein